MVKHKPLNKDIQLRSDPRLRQNIVVVGLEKKIEHIWVVLLMIIKLKRG